MTNDPVLTEVVPGAVVLLTRGHGLFDSPESMNNITDNGVIALGTRVLIIGPIETHANNSFPMVPVMLSDGTVGYMFTTRELL